MKNSKNINIDDKSVLLGTCKFGDNITIINSTLIDVVILDNVTIENSHIEKATISSGAKIGPYARIRGNTYIGENVLIGNFVEIKNSQIGARTKISHLSYVGDAEVGEDVNVGCGVVFVNYDGKNKNKTIVGDRVFIGCNSNLIAPVFLEDNSFIAAGSTITKNVMQNEIAKERTEQNNYIYKNNLYLENFMQKTKLFGTDGIRGIYGSGITQDLAKSVGYSLTKLKPKIKVLVGMDTRPSSKDLLKAICDGVFVGGGECFSCEICSTPMVSYLTRVFEFDYGVMITASHNPSEYNGIKIFNEKGYKIPKQLQLEIENNLEIINKKCKKNAKIIKKIAYFDLISSINENKLNNLSIFLDMANGSASSFAEEIFAKISSNIITKNNGGIINENASVLNEELFIENMKNSKAEIGFCFDGDADRIMAITKNGIVLTGDHILFILAKYFNEKYVVGTCMTNIGIEKEMNKHGIKVIRTDVGDINISKLVMSKKYKLGAERSGHVIIGDYMPTGDGVLVALLLTKIYSEKPELFDMAGNLIETQSENLTIECDNKKILKKVEVVNTIYEIEKLVKDKGSLVVRYSGTEPKIRITVQTETKELAQKYAKIIENCIKNAILS